MYERRVPSLLSSVHLRMKSCFFVKRKGEEMRKGVSGGGGGGLEEEEEEDWPQMATNDFHKSSRIRERGGGETQNEQEQSTERERERRD